MKKVLFQIGFLFVTSVATYAQELSISNINAVGNFKLNGEVGISGQVLTSNGTTKPPTWVDSPFSLPFSGTAVANGSTNLFKLTNSGTGFVAQFNVSNTANANGGLFVSNLGIGLGVNSLNSNTNNPNPAVRGQTFGTGFAGEFISSNATPKALKTTGGLQHTGIGEGLNKVLTSDANGNATWQTLVVPTATTTSYYNASNLDFMPYTNFLTEFAKFTRDDAVMGTCYFSSAANESQFMIAPIDLPDGAIINQMKTFFVDNSTGASGKNITILLIRRQKASSTHSFPELIISTNITTDGSNTNVRTVQATVATNNVVDNQTYHYFIKATIDDGDLDSNLSWVGNLLAIRDVELQYVF
jgi:hypothetical protein